MHVNICKKTHGWLAQTSKNFSWNRDFLKIEWIPAMPPASPCGQLTALSTQECNTRYMPSGKSCSAAMFTATSVTCPSATDILAFKDVSSISHNHYSIVVRKSDELFKKLDECRGLIWLADSIIVCSTSDRRLWTLEPETHTLSHRPKKRFRERTKWKDGRNYFELYWWILPRAIRDSSFPTHSPRWHSVKHEANPYFER